MSLIQRQLENKIAEKTLEYLQQGFVPGNIRVLAELRNFIATQIGVPTMKLRLQPANYTIDVDGFNMSMKELAFDIRVLYEELVEHVRRLMARFHSTEIIYRASSKDLDRLLSRLDEILFTVKNADDHFGIFLERFETMEKTNQDLTTPGMVDLREGTLILPETKAATRRIRADHLMAQRNWPVRILTGQEISEAGSMAGAPFGAAFEDMISAWRYRIVTHSAGPLKAQFEFPIAGPAENEAEVEISRIQIVPHTEYPFLVDIQKSVDNVNWTVIPGIEKSIVLSRQSEVANLDFSVEVIQYLRMTITKEVPDRQLDDNTWEYVFGFSSIGMYTMGRVPSATYVSKPFKAKKPIGSVSLEAGISVPRSTNTRFFVGLADSTGSLTGRWQPIAPANTSTNNPLYPNIVKFGESEVRKVEYVSPSGNTAYDTWKGTDLYSINPTGLLTGESPLFGTAVLDRGEDSWLRNRNPQTEIFMMGNVYVDFSAADNQSMYIISTEDVAPRGVSGNPQTALPLGNPPYYDPTQGHTLVPAAGVSPSYDEAPTYAVNSVEWLRDSVEATENFSGVTSTYVDLNAAGPINDGTLAVIVTRITDTSGTVTIENKLLREDVDYTVAGNRLEAVSSLVGGVTQNGWWAAQTLTGSSLDFQISYRLQTELTRMVSAITNNVVILDTPFSYFDSTDIIRVTYRRKIDASITLLPETLKAKPKYGKDALGNLFVEGRDYTIDATNGSIYRIPNGEIPSNGVVYLDFMYETTLFPVQTFSVWAYVGRSDFPEIAITSVSVDKKEGESFILSTRKGLIDLTGLGKIIPLPVGWHQFIVKSKDPTNPAAAINQVMKLLDPSGAVIFRSRGKYFDVMTANRSPMRQVPYDFLKKGILPAEHGFFAIHDNGNIVVNFSPGTTDEIYSKRYDVSNNAIVDFLERFKIAYSVRTRIVPSEQLLVKIELIRQSSADGGITPKVREYALKVLP